jgi:hypothetical protein
VIALQQSFFKLTSEDFIEQIPRQPKKLNNLSAISKSITILKTQNTMCFIIMHEKHCHQTCIKEGYSANS